MKKTINILLAVFCLTLFSCQKENIWGDNEKPEVYLTPSGITDNVVWNYESGAYEAFIGVNLGGVRPANQNSTITVGFSVDEAIVNDYNADITNQYSGSIEMLPSDCYSVAGNSIDIVPGEVSAKIKVTFNTKTLAAFEMKAGKKYVVPIRLTSSSSYELNSDAEMNTIMYGVTIAEPSFYFFINKNGATESSYKFIYGAENEVDEYEIAGYGIPEGEYSISVKYDPAAMAASHAKDTIIPEDAFTIINDGLVYKSEFRKALLGIKYNQDKLDFGVGYYLPLTIEDNASYKANAEKKTIFVKVEMKNEYEKLYGSVMSVNAEATNRTAAYSAKKTPSTCSADVVEMLIAANNTLAGAKVDAATSTTYNNKYIRIKIIPTSDKSHYDIEYVPVTNKAKKNNTPTGFEPIPGEDNYYDWMEEKFVLNYRWQHIEKKDTSWINVSEIMTAK